MVLKCWLNWESKLKQQEIFTCNDEKVGCDNTASEKSAIFLTNDRQGLGAISIFANTALWDWHERLKRAANKKEMATDRCTKYLYGLVLEKFCVLYWLLHVRDEVGNTLY